MWQLIVEKKNIFSGLRKKKTYFVVFTPFAMSMIQLSILNRCDILLCWHFWHGTKVDIFNLYQLLIKFSIVSEMTLTKTMAFLAFTVNVSSFVSGKYLNNINEVAPPTWNTLPVFQLETSFPSRIILKVSREKNPVGKNSSFILLSITLEASKRFGLQMESKLAGISFQKRFFVLSLSLRLRCEDFLLEVI